MLQVIKMDAKLYNSSKTNACNVSMKRIKRSHINIYFILQKIYILETKYILRM